MTTDQLDALPRFTPVYIPTGWNVRQWLTGGRIEGSNYYLAYHPPTASGEMSLYRPENLDIGDILSASTDETDAWRATIEQLQARIDWIKTHKLSSDEQPA